eukprot:COSAG06_NODE_17915_length_914_cov_1.584049_2_plen_167_part_00
MPVAAHWARPAQRCAPALAWGARKATGECTTSRACGWRSKPQGRARTRSARAGLAAAAGTGVPPSMNPLATAPTWKARGAPAALRRPQSTGGCAGASDAAGGLGTGAATQHETSATTHFSLLSVLSSLGMVRRATDWPSVPVVRLRRPRDRPRARTATVVATMHSL